MPSFLGGIDNLNLDNLARLKLHIPYSLSEVNLILDVIPRTADVKTSPGVSVTDAQIKIKRGAIFHFDTGKDKAARNKDSGANLCRDFIADQAARRCSRGKSIGICIWHLRKIIKSGIWRGNLRSTASCPNIWANAGIGEMKRFTDAGRQALRDKNFYAALSSALIIPDVCGSLENPGAGRIKREI